MTDDPDLRDTRPAPVPHVSARKLGPAALPVWLRLVILACCLTEAALWLAGFLGYPIARNAALMLGGFWSPVLWQGGGLYPGQQIVMFLSYGLLHAGLLHLAMNMIALAALGRELSRMTGPARMALIYVTSQIAGAAVFAVMQPAAGPMIGASGAVFGVAGALVVQTALTLRRRGRPTTPLVRTAGLLLALNIALPLLIPSIAWEAHLGGGIAGAALGLAFVRPRA